jgi:hypothetical protein
MFSQDAIIHQGIVPENYVLYAILSQDASCIFKATSMKSCRDCCLPPQLLLHVDMADV